MSVYRRRTGVSRRTPLFHTLMPISNHNDLNAPGIRTQIPAAAAQATRAQAEVIVNAIHAPTETMTAANNQKAVISPRRNEIVRGACMLVQGVAVCAPI